MKIRHPFLIKLSAWCLAMVLRLISQTVRYRLISTVPGTDPVDPDTPQHYVYAIWHDEVLIPITYRTKLKTLTSGNRVSALVSRHEDGSILTEFMKHFTIGAVRGSSSKGGALAVRQLIESSRRSHIVITPDGPRGPRHKVKQGIVYVASQTGLSVIPQANAITRCWDLKGRWTNQIVPKPFSTAYLLLGRPIHIPPDLSRDQIAEYQTLLENELNRLGELAAQFASGEKSELTSDDLEAKPPLAA